MHKPQNNYLTFSKEKYESAVESGVLISDADKKKIRGQHGKVISVSDHITTIKPGDGIIYDQHNAFEVMVYGELVSCCRLQDVILVK